MRKYLFELYVMGESTRSQKALAHLHQTCKEYFDESGYEIKVIDILEQSHVAKDNDIVTTPTLIKVSPLPIRRIVGDFSNTAKLLDILDLKSQMEENSES